MEPDAAPLSFGRFPCLCLFAACLAAAPLLSGKGALEWKTTQIELTAWNDQKEVIAVFPFRNSGREAVTVTSISTSCNCTTAQLPKTTYAPGESGQLKAFFELGGRAGRQEKEILVATNEGPEGYATLTLGVEIRELVSCTPRVLIWKRGEAPGEKSVDLVAAPSQRIAQVTATPEFPAFAARIEAVEPGIRYRLWLKPVSTSREISISVPCSIQMQGRGSPPLTLYASVD